jgi:carbamoyl-phosphate synthase small subunit
VNAEDPEADGPQVSGVVVRELSRSYSNWRASGDLATWLGESGIPILHGVDTRKLTKHLRTAGVMKGVIGSGSAVTDAAKKALADAPSMEGLDLATGASTTKPYTWGQPDSPHHIVAVDFGIKRNILRLFEAHGCRITVVPSNTSAAEIMRYEPDGVFFSNGPGDPAAVAYAPSTIRDLAKQRVPSFGICLGHQLIALSFGGSTVKMPYGHRGGNHPVKDLDSGKILITSQNHGFAVKGSEDEIPGAPDLEVTHMNLNDNTIAGLRHRSLPLFGVQYHPEAAPGPHDARPLFKQFINAVRSDATRSGPTA